MTLSKLKPGENAILVRRSTVQVGAIGRRSKFHRSVTTIKKVTPARICINGYPEKFFPDGRPDDPYDTQHPTTLEVGTPEEIQKLLRMEKAERRRKEKEAEERRKIESRLEHRVAREILWQDAYAVGKRLEQLSVLAINQLADAIGVKRDPR